MESPTRPEFPDRPLLSLPSQIELDYDDAIKEYHLRDRLYMDILHARALQADAEWTQAAFRAYDKLFGGKIVHHYDEPLGWHNTTARHIIQSRLKQGDK